MKFHVQKSSEVTGAGDVHVEDVVGLALVPGVPVHVAGVRRDLRDVVPVEGQAVTFGPGLRKRSTCMPNGTAVGLCALVALGPLGRGLGALAAAAALPEQVVGDVDRPGRERGVAEVDGLDVEEGGALVVEVDRDRPVLEELFGGAQVCAGLGVERVDGVLHAVMPSASFSKISLISRSPPAPSYCRSGVYVPSPLPPACSQRYWKNVYDAP